MNFIQLPVFQKMCSEHDGGHCVSMCAECFQIARELIPEVLSEDGTVIRYNGEIYELRTQADREKNEQ